jgi:hypothetical protein
MLNVQSDRIDYRKLLSPPPKHRIDFAVATTYSLDLETLAACCAIVGLNAEADTELTKSPLHMLEAIRKASKNLLIFCQGGRIKTPDKPNRLLPLLEDCVCEVNLKNKRAFHPKTWFIRYTSIEKKPDRYRLAVLSRNLTFDRSWDVALRLDSADNDDDVLPCESGSGAAMKDFLLWLSGSVRFHTDMLKKKKSRICALADDISNVKWRCLGKEYDGFGFIPYGIGSDVVDNLGDTFHKMFIISPFLSKGQVSKFAEGRLSNPDCTLITRRSELPKLNTELLNAFNTYVVKDDVVDGEERISDRGDYQQQDIHAKVYLRTKQSFSELYLGSANASYNAFCGGNVECLLVLYGKQRYLNAEKLKADLGLDKPDDKSCAFERAEAKNYTALPEDIIGRNLEAAIKEYCAARKSASVTGDAPYSITVTSKIPATDAKLTLSPLMPMRISPKPADTEVTFTGLALRELSEWYKVTAEKGGQKLSRVVKIPTSGIPAERDSAVFSDIVRNKDAFLSYISFLLSDDFIAAFLESLKKEKGDFRYLNMSYDAPILYERMLKAAYASPDSLREVREIIRLTAAGIVPPDFIKLYEQFEKAVRL